MILFRTVWSISQALFSNVSLWPDSLTSELVFKTMMMVSRQNTGIRKVDLILPTTTATRSDIPGFEVLCLMPTVNEDVV